MKPEEINKLNRLERLKREGNTIKKYCPYCGRIYEKALPEQVWCKTCNHQLSLYTDNIPKCPTCQSIKVEKISTTSRVVHGAAFGILSKTARSQFKCRNCGYKW